MRKNIYLILVLAASVSAIFPASAIVNSVDASRERRSLKIAAKIPIVKKLHGAVKLPVIGKIPAIAKIPVIGHLFASSVPEIPHLGTYPIWKVHRYHGISLQPVPYPGETIPSTLPVPPNLSGEPPSIVNVPDPNYAPHDAPAPPANEYGVPHSAPEPAPYPSPAPYPQPSPYQSPPYTAPAPSPPYSPVYNSPVHSGGHEYSVEGGLDLSTVQALLPPELFVKVQQYASTPGGHERIHALLGLADNARKLKSNAAHTIQGMFQKLFGGAGGSTNVALGSGTYTNIPEVYPVPQGYFNQFRPVGTGISGSPLPKLPEVPSLPEIPGLQTLPLVPELPHINIPDINPHSAHGPGGSYVSVQFPQTPNTYSNPEGTYSPPSPMYAPPQPVPPQQYSSPASQYDTPQIPSTSYGTPVGPIYSYPQSTGSATSSYFQAPQHTYGAPDASFAASENQEQFEDSDDDDQQDVNEVKPQVSLKTTKLHKVQDSRLHQGEALRSYQDTQRGFRPSRKDQNVQTDDEIVLDVED